MILAGIKTKLTSQLNEQFHLDNLQMDSPVVLAAVLDPRFRKLSFLTDAERNQVHDVLIEKASSTRTHVYSCSSQS